VLQAAYDEIADVLEDEAERIRAALRLSRSSDDDLVEYFESDETEAS
jgi:hypothetical protein